MQLQLYTMTIEMWTPRSSVKQTCFLVHLATGLYKSHWIVQMLGCLSRKVVQQSYSTTAKYKSTGVHSTSLRLTFLTSIQQGSALKLAIIVLNSTSIN